MLQLIAMFILGVIFASCCWACIMVHSWPGIKDITDEEIREMEKWYRENYGEDNDSDEVR